MSDPLDTSEAEAHVNPGLDPCTAVVTGILAAGGAGLFTLTLGWGVFEALSGPFSALFLVGLLLAGAGACGPLARDRVKRGLLERVIRNR